MKKLKLEHLAPYLPYRLNIMKKRTKKEYAEMIKVGKTCSCNNIKYPTTTVIHTFHICTNCGKPI